VDFRNILEDITGAGEAYMPYAARDGEGNWIDGFISIDFLNANFGQYETASEMKAATTSEGLRLFFDWLVEQGKLPA
jgi:hypothetical protein